MITSIIVTSNIHYECLLLCIIIVVIIVINAVNQRLSKSGRAFEVPYLITNRFPNTSPTTNESRFRFSTPSSHSKNSLSQICSKGWVAQKTFC